MVGIPAKPTLVDVADYQKDFVPYGTPCNESCDPPAQRLEALQAEVDELRARLAELIEEREQAGGALRQRDRA
jgi:serine O-acetyltransferase